MRRRAVLAEAAGMLMRDARLAAGLSQADVAEALGVSSRKTVAHWERGRASPNMDTFIAACHVCGYNVYIELSPDPDDVMPDLPPGEPSVADTAK